jgi:DNA repair exonuclease SbcCD ATPase subunit
MASNPKAASASDAEPLYITELMAENYKKLKAVRIKPDGSVVQITGRNGQGKTSVLDSIAAALGGKAHVAKDPLRHGTDRGVVLVDLGKLKVARHFKRTEEGDVTERLVVEFADGTRPKQPQAVLDELVGELGFDPLQFIRLDPADQFETLRRFVPAVDFDAIDAANKKDYEERTVVGRRAREEKAAADAVQITLGSPSEVTDTAALRSQLAEAAATNSSIATRKGRRETAAAEIDQWRTQAEQLRTQADELEKKAADQQAKLDAAPPLTEPVDVSALNHRITVAEKLNEQARVVQDREKHLLAARQYQEHYDALTSQIDSRTREMQGAISAAKMPIDGLSLGSGRAVYFMGVPLEQASAAEQLRVSTAIAMALNPQVKAILIRDGSLLDKDSMRMLAQIAEANKFQVFIERVTDGAGAGVVIEDGEVRNGD